MQGTGRGSPRPSGTSLNLGQLAAAMALAALAGTVVGLVVVAIDVTVLSPPPFEVASLESVRTLLGSIIGGLITVAVFSLWMRTVVVGLVSGHFSPRTLVTFLEDAFQRNLLAAMAAGVVTTLVILLAVPEEEGHAPLLGTVLAALIALAALAAVLLAIQHATRSLSLPELVARLTDEALEVLGRQPEARVELDDIPPAGHEEEVRATGMGWVVDIDLDRIRECLPPGGVAHLRTRMGHFVTPHTRVAVVSLADAEESADVDGIAESIHLARTRSPDHDLAFAIGQLVDVGAYALHGSTDTATGHEVLVHLGGVLEAMVERGLPLLHDADADGRIVHDQAGWEAADHLQLVVERLRDPASHDPESARHLMNLLGRVREVAERVDDRSTVSEIGRQIELLLGLVDANGMLDRDRERLQREADQILQRD